jgi:uncharacterized phage infection (PIP) family protein YhgE
MAEKPEILTQLETTLRTERDAREKQANKDITLLRNTLADLAVEVENLASLQQKLPKIVETYQSTSVELLTDLQQIVASQKRLETLINALHNKLSVNAEKEKVALELIIKELQY